MSKFALFGWVNMQNSEGQLITTHSQSLLLMGEKCLLNWYNWFLRKVTMETAQPINWHKQQKAWESIMTKASCAVTSLQQAAFIGSARLRSARLRSALLMCMVKVQGLLLKSVTVHGAFKTTTRLTSVTSWQIKQQYSRQNVKVSGLYGIKHTVVTPSVSDPTAERNIKFPHEMATAELTGRLTSHVLLLAHLIHVR